MKVFCIGCGRWGSFLSWYLSCVCGHDVVVYGRENSPRFISLRDRDPSGAIVLPTGVEFTSDISLAERADALVVSIGAQNFRELMQEIAPVNIQNKYAILCMKGLEADTGLRLSQIAQEYLHPSNSIAVWLGPGHVEEMLSRRPNCMVIDSNDQETKRELVREFSSDIIRFYYGTDMIGNEIGAASKNVIGIAAGMLDGLGLSNLKGALMSRATYEISGLIEALGGNRLSAYGLCHLGDYEATIFSKYSHNRRFGEAIVENCEYSLLAEGYYTAKALVTIMNNKGLELPICSAVYNIIYNHTKPRDELNLLFLRSLKYEN